jgi:hypothetical protein
LKDDTIDIRFPGPRNPKMESVWAWIGEDASGTEYVLGADLGHGPQPFITSMKSVIEKARPFATAHRRAYGVPVRLVRFTGREKLEELP